MEEGTGYRSRSFWITMYAISGSIFLSWFLKDAVPFTVVTPAAITAWFGGKFAQSLKPGQPKE